MLNNDTKKKITDALRRKMRDNSISICELLDSGGFGEVYSIIGKSLPPKAVVKISSVKTNYNMSNQRKKLVAHRKEKLHRELAIIKDLSSFGDHFTTAVFTCEIEYENTYYYVIVQKFYQKAVGYIDNIKSKNGGRLPEHILLAFGRDIAAALDIFHKRFRTIHKDVKPSNCFVVFPENDLSRPRFILGDFGNCPEYKNNGTVSYTQTPLYAPSDNTYYGYTYDLYMLAQSMYELANGCTINELRNAGEPVSYKGISSHIASVIKQATSVDPKKRFHSAMEFRQTLCKESKNNATRVLNNQNNSTKPSTQKDLKKGAMTKKMSTRKNFRRTSLKQRYEDRLIGIAMLFLALFFLANMMLLDLGYIQVRGPLSKVYEFLNNTPCTKDFSFAWVFVLLITCIVYFITTVILVKLFNISKNTSLKKYVAMSMVCIMIHIAFSQVIYERYIITVLEQLKGITNMA